MDLTAGLYLFITFFILALTTDKLPFVKIARTISALSSDSFQTIQAANIEDSEKQEILLKNSLGIMKASLKIIFFTSVLIGLLLLSLEVSVLIMHLNYDYLEDILISFSGMLLSIISFAFYFSIKKLYGRRTV